MPRTHDSQDTNDLAYAIAKRAKELANETMDELRLMLTTSAEGSIHAARQELAGHTRGELIEAILCDEFVEEFPRTIGEDGE